mmetsp:Transcript_7623/g.20236  ORF Transcript_7623/g.20236 Transcript_7623/m.20236 type:complete len:111 (+) Transcript_7623:65-397(+)|eukprot:CAMPEP_0185833742 /NCGR_PEP_ID=MMETSP1353-20130828/3368_1 /TAXON_ID=1077150 /ORGANISM="Erythrolobus australicus, Strain CCMP3124" /LENGTH=110 /DNA_ID=CAMNT_0028532065 /DNA_START=64 /DNA_END=396 /DNA_ORIENTATION=+
MAKKAKKGADNVGSRLALVIKSGKYAIGYKSTLRSMRSGKCKLILIANNCPPLRKSELEYYAMLAKCQVHHFAGTNNELGVACSKFYRASVMSITDPGDSDIVRAMAPES